MILKPYYLRSKAMTWTINVSSKISSVNVMVHPPLLQGKPPTVIVTLYIYFTRNTLPEKELLFRFIKLIKMALPYY